MKYILSRRPSIISGVSLSKRRRVHNYPCTHTHTDVCVCSRCWEYFVSVKVVQRRGDQSQPLDSSEDTFRGLRKPKAFTLFPDGNIHRCCSAWHSWSRTGGVVHRAKRLRCYQTHFILFPGRDEMEMLHHKLGVRTWCRKDAPAVSGSQSIRRGTAQHVPPLQEHNCATVLKFHRREQWFRTCLSLKINVSPWPRITGFLPQIHLVNALGLQASC